MSSASEGLEFGPVTPFTDYLANLGCKEDPGLLLLRVDGEMVIPSKFLLQTGLLHPLVRTINVLYLRGTCEQKLEWWTTRSINLNGRAPIDCLGDASLKLILIGMAICHQPERRRQPRPHVTFYETKKSLGRNNPRY